MKKKYWDLASGVFLFLISIVLYVGAMNVKTLEVSTFGSGFFPKIVAILLALTSLPIILGGIKQAKTDGEEVRAAGNPRWKAVVATFVLMMAYAALLPYIGFIITTAVYLFLQINILSEDRHRRQILFAVISLVSAVVIFYLFVKVFNLMLPAGILG